MDFNGFETLATHSGWKPDGFSRSTSVPIYMTNAYEFTSNEQARKLFALEEDGSIYSRLSNPTTDVFEARLAALENSTGALATSSGHAAIYALAVTLCKSGDSIVSSSCIYGGALNMFRHTLPRCGINVRFAHPLDLAGFEKAIDDTTKFIFVETLGNPTCDVADIPALAALAHAHGIPLVVDSTFTTPYLFRPADFGADIIIHSTTKYIGGHGTAMGGAIVDSGKFDWAASGRFPEMTSPDPSYHGVNFCDTFGAKALITKLRVCTMRDLGFCPSPFNSFLMLQGLETLALRMDKHCSSARAVCEYLEKSSAVECLRTPYASDSVYRDLGLKLMPKGFGGVLSFDIKGGRPAGAKFIDSLKLFMNVANLGDARSLVSHPASTTHSQLSDAELKAGGIAAGTVRLSIGLESEEDILADISQALKASQE